MLERRQVLGGGVRHRGGLAGAPGVARLVRGLDAPASEDRLGPAPPSTATSRCRSTRATPPSRPDGRPISFFNDVVRTQESIARYSKKDAAAYPGFENLLNRAASFLRPLLLRPPPALGSKRPGDLLGLLRGAGRAAELAKRDVHKLFRVMTMSVGDLLDDWFETDELKGTIGSTGASSATPGRVPGRRAPPTTCCTTRSAAEWRARRVGPSRAG